MARIENEICKVANYLMKSHDMSLLNAKLIDSKNKNGGKRKICQLANCAFVFFCQL